MKQTKVLLNKNLKKNLLVLVLTKIYKKTLEKKIKMSSKSILTTE